MSILTNNSEFRSNVTKVKHPFYDLNKQRLAANFVAFNPSEDIIASLVQRASPYIQPMAETDTILRVYRENPDTVVAFQQVKGDRESEHPAMGLLANLPLTHDGFRALFDGSLNTLNPASQFLSKQHQTPAAIYYWCIYQDPGAAGGLPLAVERMAKFRHLPTFCRAANEKAHRFISALGFRDGATGPEGLHFRRDLMQYHPPARPLFDSYGYHKPRADELGIQVAHGFDAVMKAISIRGAAYVEGRFVPVTEDIDGNDTNAIHLLAYLGDEPVGCIRIRHLNNSFLKLERLAVIGRFQRKGIAKALIEAALEFGQVKGMTGYYVHVADNAWPVWEKIGFKKLSRPAIEYPSGEVYHEAVRHLPMVESQLSLGCRAHVLVRPEGQWDRPGILESGGR